MQLIGSHRNIWLQVAFQSVQTRFQSLRAALKASMARRERFRSTYTELCALSNWDLADLGISRSQIHSIALQEMAKEPKL